MEINTNTMTSVSQHIDVGQMVIRNIYKELVNEKLYERDLYEKLSYLFHYDLYIDNVEETININLLQITDSYLDEEADILVDCLIEQHDEQN